VGDLRHHIGVGDTGGFAKRVYYQEAEKRIEEHGAYRKGHLE
jgi:hypothetical protein